MLAREVESGNAFPWQNCWSARFHTSSLCPGLLPECEGATQDYIFKISKAPVFRQVRRSDHHNIVLLDVQGRVGLDDDLDAPFALDLREIGRASCRERV